MQFSCHKASLEGRSFKSNQFHYVFFFFFFLQVIFSMAICGNMWQYVAIIFTQYVWKLIWICVIYIINTQNHNKTSKSHCAKWYSWYSTLWRQTDPEEKKSSNKAVILVFFAHKYYFCSFIELRLNHCCHMDYLNYAITTFQGLERSLAVYGGSESSQISSKISSFVFWRWTKVLQVWNDMRASN